MRETPQNIDRSTKSLEYVAAFLMPAVLFMPVLQLWAIPVALVFCGLTIKFSAGKSPGFFQEWAYKKGIALPTLLPTDLTHLDN